MVITLFTVMMLLLTIIMIMDRFKRTRNYESFISFDEIAVRKMGVLSENEIAFNNDVVTSSNYLIDASKLNMNNQVLFSDRQHDTRRQIGNSNVSINIPEKYSFVALDDMTVQPDTNFNKVHFMDNVYLQGDTNVNANSICFMDSNIMHCLDTADISDLNNIDIEDLQKNIDMLRGACIPINALQMNDEGAPIQDTYKALDDSMICVNESVGIDKLKNWYDTKNTV